MTLTLTAQVDRTEMIFLHSDSLVTPAISKCTTDGLIRSTICRRTFVTRTNKRQQEPSQPPPSYESANGMKEHSGGTEPSLFLFNLAI